METSKHTPEASEEDLILFLLRLVRYIPYQPRGRDIDDPVVELIETIGDTSFSYSIVASQERSDEWSIVVVYEHESDNGLEDDSSHETNYSQYEFKILTGGDKLALETSFSKQRNTEFSNGNRIDHSSYTVINDEKLMELSFMLDSGRFNPIEAKEEINED